MKKILVIDDDSALRKLAMNVLRKHGYEVIGAGNGAEGLALTRAEQPDLVLSDVNMAGTNGFAFLKELRGEPQIAAIPVIMMTGEPHHAGARFTMDHGADDYLPKPFSMQQMLAAVGARLQRSASVEASNQAERLSTAKQLRLQTTALEAAANGIAISQRDGKIVWVNPAFTALTGYAPEEIIGRTHAVLNSGRHPKEFYVALWETILAGRVWHGEIINKRRDGTLYHEEMTITPLKEGEGEGGSQYFIAIKSDITARKRAEEVLRQKQMELRVLLDWMPAMIWFKDTKNNILRANRRAAEAIGRSVEEVEGRSVAEFYPDQARRYFVDDLLVIGSRAPKLGSVEKILDRHGNERWLEKDRVPVCDHNGEVSSIVVMAHDITERKLFQEQLEEVRNEHAAVLSSLGEGVHWVDVNGRIKFENPAAAKMLGYAVQELVGQPAHETMHHSHADGTLHPKTECGIYATLRDGQIRRVVDDVFWRKDGTCFAVDYICSPIYDKHGKSQGAVVVFTDITERKQLEAQLVHAKKMETVGQLAAGIAHEINTPLQYVGDNTRFVRDSFVAIGRVLQSHQALLRAVKDNTVTPALLQASEDLAAASDLEYLCEQIPAALTETLEGIERASKIVRAMKEFSHPGGKEKTPADLNRAIQSTVTVAKNEWKYVADLKLELDPDLPPVPCLIGEINQCVLNLIVNAAHAIGDVVGKNPAVKGLITLQTRRDGGMAELRVADTGTGIPEHCRSKIFEPFFTTKDVGKGTGQGLSIVFGTIVKGHGGTVAFETETGRGTTFILRLPLQPAAAPPNPDRHPHPEVA